MLQEDISVKVGVVEAEVPSWRDAKPAELCETSEGRILFTDINIISGMEQASFLFQQVHQYREEYPMTVR